MNTRLIALLLITASFGAFADDAGKRANVDKLLELTDADAMIETVYSQIEQMTGTLSSQLEIKPSEQQYFDKYMAAVTRLMQEEMGWDAMKDDFIEIYMTHFTEKEIADLVVFYESDTGRSLTRKMPQIMQDSMLLSQNMLQSILPKFQVLAQELQNDLRAARAAN